MAHQPTGSLRNVYLERYAYPKTFISDSPLPNLELIVTIPCHNEESLVPCLESLKKCELPKGIAIEVIAIINESETAGPEIEVCNQKCFEEARQWAKTNSSRSLTFFILYEKLPKKHAGVGLARKVAMDEAVKRFEVLNKSNGIILCYDVDCSCDPNYLREVYDYFKSHPQCPGTSIYFEHPLEGTYANEIYQAIIDYELFLRYYVNALRYAKFPHAFETIGSSMAVRSFAYQKQGGMNRRKAGEDFYFLHRIIPLGNFGEINTTRVIPSPRQSDRVPFGTGRAVNQWLEKRELNTYALATFEDLGAFIDLVPELFSIPYQQLSRRLPQSIVDFLTTINFEEALDKLKRNAASEDTFFKQFFQWFDGFKVLKYVHFARDHFYHDEPVAQTAAKLLTTLTGNDSSALSARELLLSYRKRDRFEA